MAISKGKKANVAKVCNLFDFPQPMLIEKLAVGYRISARGKFLTPESRQEAIDYVKKITNVNISFSKRRDHVGGEGTWDIIVPYAKKDHDEVMYTHGLPLPKGKYEK